MSGSGFTLQADGRTYTVSIGSGTTYDFAPGLAATLGDVGAGERVTVTGSVAGSSVTASAVHLHLWGERGVVTAIQGDSVDVREASGRTATIQLPSAPDVLVGQQLEGFGSWRQDTLIARAFRVVPAHLDGSVESVSGNTAEIKTPSGESATLTWSSSTVFTNGPAVSGSVDLLTAGVQVHAEGQWSGSTFVAAAIDVRPAHLDGVVESVSGSSAQVRTPDGQNVTLEWTGSTRFTRGPRGTASASLVTVGGRIHAQGRRAGSVFTATRIDLPPVPPAVSPGQGGGAEK